MAAVEALPSTYACIFGISEKVPGIEKGTLTSVFNKNFSYLVPSGPGNRTYWFLVRNLGKTVYGADIPRFTKQEEEALAKEHWNDHITETLRFSDLYENKINSVYTSLPEYVYKKWYFQRVMTIGDACHKVRRQTRIGLCQNSPLTSSRQFEPLTGQGGNSAIETAAALTNHLISALDKSTSQPLSKEDISSVFEKVQRQREDRVWGLVKASHARQRLECMETSTLRFIARYVFPYIPESIVMHRWIQTYCPAVSLGMFPLPNRPKKIPFHDEKLEENPGPRAPVGVVMYAGYIVLVWVALRDIFNANKVVQS